MQFCTADTNYQYVPSVTKSIPNILDKTREAMFKADCVNKLTHGWVHRVIYWSCLVHTADRFTN